MKNKKIMILVIVLSTLVLLLTSYIVYDKVQDNKKVENKDEVRDLSDLEKNILVQQIKKYNQDLLPYYPIKNVSKIPNNVLFDFAMLHTNDDTFFAPNLDNTISKYFDDSAKIKHENYICEMDDKVLYIYNEKTQRYSYNSDHLGHGGGAFLTDNIVYFDSGTVTNEKEYTIKTKNLYSAYCFDACPPNGSYYTNFSDAFDLNNPILGDPENYEEYIVTDEDYNRIKDSIPITTYKFIKDENSNYKLKSVSIKEEK